MADRLGLTILIGTTDGAPALQAVVRPREMALAARLALMALVEDRVDHTLWSTPGPAYPLTSSYPSPGSTMRFALRSAEGYVGWLTPSRSG